MLPIFMHLPASQRSVVILFDVLELQRFVDLFNARDFEALRTMLAPDVRLDLVNRPQLKGPAVGETFARYGQTCDWRAWAGQVEGQPAVLVQQGHRGDERPDYFVVLGWADDRVLTLRDFLFARYVVADAECSSP